MGLVQVVFLLYGVNVYQNQLLANDNRLNQVVQDQSESMLVAYA